MGSHKDSVDINMHVAHALEYADQATREAATPDITYLKKLALQLDDYSYWVLSSIEPTVWVAVGGGGGVEAPAEVIPTSISGCVRWYDAAQDAGAEGATVATITDRSASAVNLTQSTEANKAVLRNNAANGKPAWQFDGVDDYYTMGSNLDLATTHTVLIVQKSINKLYNYSVILKYKQRGIYAPIATTSSWGTYNGGPVYLGPLSATPQLIGFWGSSNGDWYAVNGKMLWKGPTVSFNGDASTTVGRDQGGTQLWAGFLMEMIVYNTKIAQADLLALTKHLHYKWGIPDFT